jgi:hypothetical protein
MVEWLIAVRWYALPRLQRKDWMVTGREAFSLPVS